MEPIRSTRERWAPTPVERMGSIRMTRDEPSFINSKMLVDVKSMGLDVLKAVLPIYERTSVLLEKNKIRFFFNSSRIHRFPIRRNLSRGLSARKKAARKSGRPGK
jgi:hypothetical protein